MSTARARAARRRRPARRAGRALSLLALGLAGCFATPAAEEYYYVLAAPAGVALPAAGPALAVAELQLAPGYESARLAYRTTPHELRYYGYRRWAAEPASLLTRALVQHLRASRRFRRVEDEARLPQADAVVDGTVEALEELDRGAQTFAHLAGTLSVRRPDGTLLLQQAFDETRRCPRRDPPTVVAALSRILAEQAQRLAVRTAHELRR